ncbi:anti-sigma factor [Jiella sonneratiae]|uniref:Regulator of SigK n=1 Tax=Jiella sonneratiae TaxID=2816856 RepID=A0ABS3J8I8_9HYPH|nr:anti-sigma factor [Jiella sonneratiae]MBO0905990.1 anti-sigma factor [Jiella sonneratiae]
MNDLRRDDGDEADPAAEYALGVLDGADRRAAQRRIERDPAFAAEVAAWDARLAPLYAAIQPVEPPAGVWPGIAGELARMRRVAAADGRERPRGRRVSGIWQWIGLSGMGLAAASLAALILVSGNLAGLGTGNTGDVFENVLVGTLASDQGQALFTVVMDRDHDIATLIPVTHENHGNRVPELWVVPPNGGAPLSLGLINAERPAQIHFKNRPVGEPKAALAVSLEPPGGSPTGQPTGPVVASGALDRI